jgi:hypothetical protein
MGKNTLPLAWALNISKDDNKAKEREDIREKSLQIAELIPPRRDKISNILTGTCPVPP